MKLSEVKEILTSLQDVNFQLENGLTIPTHFHVTEVGMVTKNFIDCGGTIRNEKVVNFQLWSSTDYDHRLEPSKLLRIIALSEDKLGIENTDVEVEFQSETIGKYDLAFNGRNFVLMNKKTACLASDACGITPEKPIIKLSKIDTSTGCKPNSGCC